ncbi:NAD-P-binding protein [Russula earlei]|uniref:NAD-P-binding protein n=1 Tax=Russula earlei TaxID=71964 RepID=A0ACC0TYV8_9AGAM|nr:NAD-P-binding protein [Russula earlei]
MSSVLIRITCTDGSLKVSRLRGHIVRELLKIKNTGKNDNVTLTRSSQNHYRSAESLKNALIGIDVVVNIHLFAEQAKAAGVKLFVPSEFGDSTDRENPEGVFPIQVSVHHELKELDLPYALFFTEPHADYCFVSGDSAIGLDLNGGNVTVGLDGNAPNSQQDVGRFVAYVLTTLPRSKLEWRRVFRIEAERKSFNQIFKEQEERTGKRLNVTYRSESELRAAIAKNPSDLGSILQLDWGLGGGLVGTLDRLSVSKYPDWNPKSTANILYP